MSEIKPKLDNIDLGEVLGVGSALSVPRTVNNGEHPFIAIPPNWQVADLEKFLPTPLRPKGTLALGDAASFIRYVNKHKDEPGAASAMRVSRATGSVAGAPGTVVNAEIDPDDVQTVIKMDLINSKFQAVFDHDASDAPGHKQHTATYDCPLSPQWKLWTGSNGQRCAKGQEEFAFFIEQNMLDVAEPAGGDMLRIVTTLKATKNVKFDSAIRLSNGQHQLKYHEEITGSAQGSAGETQIPEKIALGIPVYVGATPYRVEAFLRYRIVSGGGISFWYDLITPDRILENALGKVRKEIEDGTGIKCYAVTTIS